MVELIWELNGVVRKITGSATADDLDASAKQIQSDSRLDTLKYIIHDFCDADEISVSETDIQFMAARACISLRKNPRVKIAFAGSHPVAIKLTDAFNTLGISHHRIARHNTFHDARSHALA